MTAIKIINWYIGRKAIIVGSDVRIEFDTAVEADGQVWVYVYRGTWPVPGHGADWAPIRRIPMGRFHMKTLRKR